MKKQGITDDTPNDMLGNITDDAPRDIPGDMPDDIGLPPVEAYDDYHAFLRDQSDNGDRLSYESLGYTPKSTASISQKEIPSLPRITQATPAKTSSLYNQNQPKDREPPLDNAVVFNVSDISQMFLLNSAHPHKDEVADLENPIKKQDNSGKINNPNPDQDKEKSIGQPADTTHEHAKKYQTIATQPGSVATEGGSKIIADKDLHGAPVKHAPNEDASLIINKGRWLTGKDIRQIQEDLNQALFISLDFETTELSPSSLPKIPSRKALLGSNIEIGVFIKEHNATIDPTPRARILSYAISETIFGAIDFDQCTHEEKRNIISLLNDKIWIGHNLAFDLMWAKSIYPVTPKFILDSTILITTLLPDVIYAAQQLVSKRYQEKAAITPRILWIRDYLNGKKLKDEDGAVSLAFLHAWFSSDNNFKPLAKGYQKPYNWMLSTLSDGHYDYCIADVSNPAKLVRKILARALSLSGKHKDSIEWLSKSKRLNDIGWDIPSFLTLSESLPGWQAYRSFAKGTIQATELTINGLPVDLAWSAKIEREIEHEINDLAEKFAASSDEIGDYLVGKLSTQGQSLSHNDRVAMANALTKEYNQKNEKDKTIAELFYLDSSGIPKINSNHLVMAFPDSEIVKTYLELVGKVNILTDVCQYRENSKISPDGRIHSMFSIKTVTGRMASRNPNIQNPSSEKRVRSIFKAKDGHKIVSIDYSSIELKIAACLCIRAVRSFKKAIAWWNEWLYLGGHEKHQPNWVPDDQHAFMMTTNSQWLLSSAPELLQYLADPTEANLPKEMALDVKKPDTSDKGKAISIKEWAAYYASEWVRVIRNLVAASNLNESLLPLPQVYSKNIDPHLLTGLHTLYKTGQWAPSTGGSDGFDGNILSYLGSVSPEKAAQLKKTHEAIRTQSKPVNFGLVYRMSVNGLYNYGTSAYRLQWSMNDAQVMYDNWFILYPDIDFLQFTTERFLFEKTSFIMRHDDIMSHERRKLFIGETLSGRRTVSHSITQALNYQDQGTGAEILFEGADRFEPDLRKYYVNSIHDEVVLEVPADRAEYYGLRAAQHLIDAGNKMMMPYGIKAEVEVNINDSWG